MAIKLVAIDIDGTLLNNRLEITSEVNKAIQTARDNGAQVVITTGRPLPGVQQVLNQLEFNGDKEYVITFNGGLVQTISGKVIAQSGLSNEDVQLLDTFSQDKAFFQLETIDSAYSTHRKISYWGNFENALVNLPLVILNKDELLNERTYIKGIFTDEPEIIDQLQKEIPKEIQEQVNVIRSTKANLEFVNKNVSKGNGIQSLADYLGIKMEEVMAIGDQENDVSMIEQAGIGVAMGNAIEHVKSIANFITATNEEDGVAKAIQKFVLNQ